MNRICFALTCCLFSISFSSCVGPNGPDGKDGQAFLTVSATYGILYTYSDNNSSREGAAGVFSYDQAYKVSPGTYNFQFESRLYNPDLSYYYADWSGAYIIWIHKGEKGGSGGIFWQPGSGGKDGENSYLTLLCNFDGAAQSRLNKQVSGSLATPDSTMISEVKVGDYCMRTEYHLMRCGHVSHDRSLPSRRKEH
jgi:hypothetical protein